MAEEKMPWMALIAIVIGVALLLLFVIMQGKVWDAIKEPGRAVIHAINDLVAGKPTWLR